jgi:potassium/hydrogen antiporter
VLSSEEAGAVREGDHLYLLAPPEKAQALDRFFVDMPPPATPDPRLLGDFFVPATATLGALAEIYGIDIAPEQKDTSLHDVFAAQFGHRVHAGDRVPLGSIALVAHRITDGQVTNVGLRLAEPDEAEAGIAPRRGLLIALRAWIIRRLRYPNREELDHVRNRRNRDRR